jgi:hypothetical protein
MGIGGTAPLILHLRLEAEWAASRTGHPKAKAPRMAWTRCQKEKPFTGSVRNRTGVVQPVVTVTIVTAAPPDFVNWNLMF